MSREQQQQPPPLSSPKPADVLWQQVLDDCKKRVSQDEWKQVILVPTYDELHREITRREAEYGRKTLPKWLKKFGNAIEYLRPFMKVVDVFVQADPSTSALVWGSIKAVVEIISASHRVRELIANFIDTICADLPRFQRLWKLFPMAKELEKAVIDVYKDVVDFFLSVLAYFRSHPIRNMARALLGKLERELGDKARRIYHQTKAVSEEVRIAGYEAEKARFESLETLLKKNVPASSPVKSSPVRCIPFSENRKFVGRDAELTEMHKFLCPEPAAVSPKALVLDGLGGIGKSELALKYAYSHSADFKSILWVPAETEDKVLAAYSDIAAGLRLVTPTHGKDENQAKNKLLSWFKSTDTTWLVIFDNAPDSQWSFIRNYWPLGAHGSILVTTRNAFLAREINIHGFPIGPIDDIAAVHLLLDREKDFWESLPQETMSEARKICSRLGNFPLRSVRCQVILQRLAAPWKASWKSTKIKTTYKCSTPPRFPGLRWDISIR